MGHSRKKNLPDIARCVEYIRRTGGLRGSLDDARTLAKSERFSVNTSVWLSAMGKFLEENNA